MNPHGVGFSLYTHIPILIGNIPLRPMFNKIKQDPGFAGGFAVSGIIYHFLVGYVLFLWVVDYYIYFYLSIEITSSYNSWSPSEVI